MKKFLKKCLVITLSINLLFSFNIVHADSDNLEQKNSYLSDIDNHWSKDWVNKAIKLGFVAGYSDGTFKPDRSITRAEFATMINRAMKITSSEKSTFSDVSDKDWFKSQVETSIAAGFFSGYPNNTFKPNNPITRQEVARVVHSAVVPGDVDGDGATFLTDYSIIQDWAKESVNIAYNKGYIMGYPNKTYQPSKALTRAEAVKIIYEIIDNENIEHKFNITNYNEEYKNAIVAGDLNILDSVGTSDITISNVIVLGSINVQSPNISSIKLENVTARNLQFTNKTSSSKLILHSDIYINKSSIPNSIIIEKTGQNIVVK